MAVYRGIGGLVRVSDASDPVSFITGDNPPVDGICLIRGLGALGLRGSSQQRLL